MLFYDSIWKPFQPVVQPPYPSQIQREQNKKRPSLQSQLHKRTFTCKSARAKSNLSEFQSIASCIFSAEDEIDGNRRCSRAPCWNACRFYPRRRRNASLPLLLHRDRVRWLRARADKSNLLALNYPLLDKSARWWRRRWPRTADGNWVEEIMLQCAMMVL